VGQTSGDASPAGASSLSFSLQQIADHFPHSLMADHAEKLNNLHCSVLLLFVSLLSRLIQTS